MKAFKSEYKYFLEL